jgi:hypothetical protein
MIGFSVMACQWANWDATGGRCNYQAVWAWVGEAQLTDKTMPLMKEHLEAGVGAPGTGADVYDGYYQIKAFIEAAGSLDPDAIAAQIPKVEMDGAQGHFAWTGKDAELPHDVKFGPEYVHNVFIQWREGGRTPVIWPDGRAVNPAFNMGTGWEGLRYPGTVDYEIPPWVKEYWKGKS